MSVHSHHKYVGYTFVPDIPLSTKNTVAIKSDIVFAFIFCSHHVETIRDGNPARKTVFVEGGGSIKAMNLEQGRLRGIH